MLDLIGRLNGFGINVLTSSHVLTDIERTCDWVVMLDGGKVLRNGPLSGLTDTGTIEVEVVGDPQPLADVLVERGAKVEVDHETLYVEITGSDAFDMVRDALVSSGTAMRRLGSRATTLEDIFLAQDIGAAE
jgi:ABC-2 type transport system ATP-binding protein